ncbi:hypothetical protein F4781DRAFT_386772 [Annulohypoxylon bovei var. microspora]|nr:hypothetical protein F4781DRAFT_386772 [Annulohypoxylon bovei var. microspora]
MNTTETIMVMFVPYIVPVILALVVIPVYILPASRARAPNAPSPPAPRPRVTQAPRHAPYNAPNGRQAYQQQQSSQRARAWGLRSTLQTLGVCALVVAWWIVWPVFFRGAVRCASAGEQIFTTMKSTWYESLQEALPSDAEVFARTGAFVEQARSYLQNKVYGVEEEEPLFPQAEETLFPHVEDVLFSQTEDMLFA